MRLYASVDTKRPSATPTKQSSVEELNQQWLPSTHNAATVIYMHRQSIAIIAEKELSIGISRECVGLPRIGQEANGSLPEADTFISCNTCQV